MDEHSVCEPVQPTYFDVLEMASNKAGGIAVSPILRAYEDRGLESSTDFLSVRVYLRSETTRSMGLGYRCGWRVQDNGGEGWFVRVDVSRGRFPCDGPGRGGTFNVSMGVAGVLGAALLCAIHGATVENTLFEDGDGSNTFRAFNPTQAEETYSMFWHY